MSSPESSDSSGPSEPSDADLDQAAARLRDAVASGTPCPPVRDLLGDTSVEAAYRVQAINTGHAEASGRTLMGWKIGLTSPAVQRQLGVDQPDFGLLFADCEIGDGGQVDIGRLLQPRVEAEVVFVMGRDLPDRPLVAADILRATEFVVPGIEIVDSRIADWDISITDTVADNASSGLHVLAPVPTALDGLDLKTVGMHLLADGTEVSSGSGAACLGHPVNAVVWLANTARRFGRPLREGDTVLSGALGPMVAVTAGTRYEATIEGLGSVSVSFDGPPDQP